MLSNTFEYDSRCYQNCANETYKHLYFDSFNNYFIDCINSIEGYYLDENDSFYKLCYDSCKTCNEQGNEYNHNCIECKDNYLYHNSTLNYTNCVINCPNYIYFDNISNHLYCTDTLECPLNYNKLIINKRECIDECKKDLDYKYDYLNICYSECPNGTINNSFYCENMTISTSIITTEIQIDSTENKINTSLSKYSNINSINILSDTNIITDTFYTNNINRKKEIIINIHNYFSIILNSDSSDEEIYYENQFDNFFAKFTTTNYLKKYLLLNRTKIDLGICEFILKDAYNISYEKPLYILILDIEEKGMKIPKVEYEVYYIRNKTSLILLNLTLCKYEKIEILIPVYIEGNIDKYNSSSGYYNDICYMITSIYGTDVCLKDRRNEFIKNNLTLCEENCNLIDYDYIYKRAKCSCEVKLNFPLIEDVKFDKEKLKKNFVDINNIANIKFLICYKIAFKKNNIKYNYGFYIMNFIIFLFLLTLFLFSFKYYNIFISEINEIISALKKNDISENINIDNNEIINDKKIEAVNINDRDKKITKIKRKIKLKKRIKKKKNKDNTAFLDILKDQNKTQISGDSKNKNGNISQKSENNIINTNKSIENKNNILNYNDNELNSLTYGEALKIDKRTFIQFYISLLRIKHLLFFSFYPNKDYNSRIIKMFLFFFNFATGFTINAFFFSDSTMHQIYEDEGSFNFIYQIPQIIYSTVLSIIINSIIKFLSLTESTIEKLKEDKRKKSENINDKLKNLITKIKIKFILFFTISISILFAFWFYIICFCGIYKNTQIHLIKDSVISFLLALIYPFGTLLLPGMLRILALKSKKKNKKLLYKLSQLLENI